MVRWTSLLTLLLLACAGGAITADATSVGEVHETAPVSEVEPTESEEEATSLDTGADGSVAHPHHSPPGPAVAGHRPAPPVRPPR